MSIAKPDAAPTSEAERNEAISKRLVDARLNVIPLSEFPEELTPTLKQAYAIQALSIDRWPDELAGWKVARLSPSDQVRYGAERLSGPVFASVVQHVESGGTVVAPIYDCGFAAVEPELVLVLGVDVAPSGQQYSDDELADLVSAIHIGAEIASSPMAAVNDLGPASVTSDFGNNRGVVVGPAITEWRAAPSEPMQVSVTVDGEVVGEASPENSSDGPLGALRFLIGCCAERGFELPRGTLVSTGTLTGVHDVSVESSSRVDFGSLGSFELAFEPITART